MYPYQTIFSLPLFDGTFSQFIEHLYAQIERGQLTAVATPNPEQIVMAQKGPLRGYWQAFNTFIPDGQGLIWAAKKLGTPLGSRITGVDVVTQILADMPGRGERALLVGGEGYQTFGNFAEGVVELDPGLFWFRNYNKNSQADEHDVLSWIHRHQPTYVFVALGAPDQEAWVAEHLYSLQESGVRCVMVVGGAFDMIRGKVIRAPKLVQVLGLEWLWRLGLEPWRWKRQLKLFQFVKMVKAESGSSE